MPYYLCNVRGYLRHGAGLANLADDIPLKRFTAFAEVMGYGLAFLAGIAAFLKALNHYGKDETWQGHLQLAESLGLAMTVCGELAATRLGAKVVGRMAGEKVGQWLTKRGALVLLTGGSLISVVILILTVTKDIIDLAIWINTPKANEMLKAFWESIEAQPALTCYESANTWVDENGINHETRPNGPAHIVYLDDNPRKKQIAAGQLYFADKGEKAKDEETSPAERRAAIRKLISKNPFRDLTWRAVVPLHAGGYDSDLIKKVVSITGVGLVMPQIKEVAEDGRKNLQWDTFRYKNDLMDIARSKYAIDSEKKDAIQKMAETAHRTQRIAMGPDEIIRFYEMVSDPSLETTQFASGKTYAEVAESLRKGTFTPDRAKPELLPEQLAFTGGNLRLLREKYPDLTATFICGDWSSPDFYEG